jgi:dTDP-6-deoxy-L-talose 4-dehydrogenase (NAD+)
MILAGVKQVLITGTCFEYGLQNGCLSEEMPTVPVTPYGLAKDTLRKSWKLSNGSPVYPPGGAAVLPVWSGTESEEPPFTTGCRDRTGRSGIPNVRGEQLRDYLPVEEVARRIVQVAGNPDCHGIINCCSGISDFHPEAGGGAYCPEESRIELELGYYPYPEYEPMAFWEREVN